jgi:hypothetical protein
MELYMKLYFVKLSIRSFTFCINPLLLSPPVV